MLAPVKYATLLEWVSFLNIERELESKEDEEEACRGWGTRLLKEEPSADLEWDDEHPDVEDGADQLEGEGCFPAVT